MDLKLLQSELGILNIYNEKYANSYFRKIDLGPQKDSEKVNMSYLATLDLNEKNASLSIFYSKKCVKLLEEENIYFLEFRKPMLAHEIIEAYQSFFMQNPHDYANDFLIKNSPIISIKDNSFKTEWLWNNVESLIKDIKLKTNKSIEEISWYLFPRLSNK